MNAVKFSFVIPYKQRLDNIRLAFESLADQTMDRSEFEVLVGAMEYSDEYVAACREFSDRLRIISVLCADEWQITKARNLAMRQASGQVIVQLDADMALPPHFLANLYDRYYAYGQQVCVLGQMFGYDNNNSDVETVEVKPYGHYQKQLAELEEGTEVGTDMRMEVDHVIPWAFAWTALVAVPTALVREYDLFFDEDFRGYGVEDLEWAHRICATGTPIVMGHDVFGIHLPHPRSVANNRATEAANYRRFLRKWPGEDVELAAAFGDFEANNTAVDFRRQLRGVIGADGGDLVLAVVRGRVKGRSGLVIGALAERGADRGLRLVVPVAETLFDEVAALEVLPLAGLALPYDDDEVAECHVTPRISRFGARYRDRILAEARRVGDVVLEWAPQD